jgi:hypothetical protein
MVSCLKQEAIPEAQSQLLAAPRGQGRLCCDPIGPGRTQQNATQAKRAGTTSGGKGASHIVQAFTLCPARVMAESCGGGDGMRRGRMRTARGGKPGFCARLPGCARPPNVRKPRHRMAPGLALRVAFESEVQINRQSIRFPLAFDPFLDQLPDCILRFLGLGAEFL